MGKKKSEERGGGFVTQALQLLAVGLVSAKRVISMRQGGSPDVRLRVETLYYANWASPVALGRDGSHCATPRSLLTSLRGALADGHAISKGDAAPSLLYISRAGQSMRAKFAEDVVMREGLKAIAGEASPALTFRIFGGEGSLKQQASIFRDARAVVGTHGGALTNLLFCSPSTLVFEIGFESPLSGHYRHLASALGIRNVHINLKVDARHGCGGSTSGWHHKRGTERCTEVSLGIGPRHVLGARLMRVIRWTVLTVRPDEGLMRGIDRWQQQQQPQWRDQHGFAERCSTCRGKTSSMGSRHYAWETWSSLHKDKQIRRTPCEEFARTVMREPLVMDAARNNLLVSQRR